jgi:hypothetical protein
MKPHLRPNIRPHRRPHYPSTVAASWTTFERTVHLRADVQLCTGLPNIIGHFPKVLCRIGPSTAKMKSFSVLICFSSVLSVSSYYTCSFGGPVLSFKMEANKRPLRRMGTARRCTNVNTCICIICSVYEVSSKTNATDLLKTKRFKLESYFLQHKVSLIFGWFIQIIVLTPKHRWKAVVSRHSPLLLLTVPGQSYVNKMWTVLDRNLISSAKHSWISCQYRKITVLTINAAKKRQRAAIRRYVCFSLVGICCRRNRLVWAIRRRFSF